MENMLVLCQRCLLHLCGTNRAQGTVGDVRVDYAADTSPVLDLPATECRHLRNAPSSMDTFKPLWERGFNESTVSRSSVLRTCWSKSQGS